MLDRGELKDWFDSSEIWIEATVAGLGFYLFTVHTATTDERSFLNRDLLKSANFVAGTRASIREWGWTMPALVDEEGVLAGRPFACWCGGKT